MLYGRKKHSNSNSYGATLYQKASQPCEFTGTKNS